MVGTLAQARILVQHPSFSWRVGDTFGADDSAPGPPARDFEWTVTDVGYPDGLIAAYKKGQPWTWRYAGSGGSATSENGDHAVPYITPEMVCHVAGRVLDQRVLVHPVYDAGGGVTGWRAIALSRGEPQQVRMLVREPQEDKVYKVLLNTVLSGGF